MVKCPRCDYYNSKEELHEGTRDTIGLTLYCTIDDVLNNHEKGATYGCISCNHIMSFSYNELKEIFGHVEKFIKEY